MMDKILQDGNRINTMQFFIDFLPVLIFFIAYKLSGMYVAVTATAITACLTFGYTWLRFRRLEPLQITSLVIICVAASLTLLFHDDAFIKWKPTLINGLFAVVFAGSLFTKRTLAERLFTTQMDCPPSIWKKITLSWICFFVICAATNYYVAFIYQVNDNDLNVEQHQNWESIAKDDHLYADLIHQEVLDELSNQQQLDISSLPAEQRQLDYLQKIHQARWVDFKLFGLLALTIVFVLGQGFFISKYINQPEDTNNESDNNLNKIL